VKILARNDVCFLDTFFPDHSAAGTREKIEFPGGIYQIPDEFRLINMKISFIAEFPETVNAAG